MRRTFAFFALIVAVCLALVGCGSESANVASTQTGRATFTVVWPQPSRLIPAASNSIRIALLDGAVEFDSRVLARPATGGTTTVTFDTVRLGNFTALATAHPQTDGTGTIQAQASVPLTVAADRTSTIALTLASTVDRLDPPAPLPTVLYNGTAAFPVTARSLTNEVILTTPGTFQWQIGNAAIATVDASGTVSGVAPGSTTLTVTETESGKTLIITPIHVTTNAVVTVTPSPLTLSINGTQAFGVTVTGIADTTVAWTIEEGVAGGTLTADGFYTAPATAGIYHIRATSQFDPEKFASVTVTVVSGSASGTIQ